MNETCSLFCLQLLGDGRFMHAKRHIYHVIVSVIVMEFHESVIQINTSI